MRGLVLIPFYFFAAVGAFLVLSVLCRTLRVTLTANAVATLAVFLGLAMIVAPLAARVTELSDYSLPRLTLLMAGTFALAALDTALDVRFPLALDRELGER